MFATADKKTNQSLKILMKQLKMDESKNTANNATTLNIVQSLHIFLDKLSLFVDNIVIIFKQIAYFSEANLYNLSLLFALKNQR